VWGRGGVEIQDDRVQHSDVMTFEEFIALR
jgi:hypothetical protein